MGSLVAAGANGVVQEGSLVAALAVVNNGRLAVNGISYSNAVLTTARATVRGSITGGAATVLGHSIGAAYASFPGAAIATGQQYTLTIVATYPVGGQRQTVRLQSRLRIAPSSPGAAQTSTATVAATRVSGTRYPHRSPAFTSDVNRVIGWIVPIGPAHTQTRSRAATTIRRAPNPKHDPPSFQVFTNSSLGLGGATVNEPSGAANNLTRRGGVVFETFNWSAALSLTGGRVWSTVDPTTIFPNPDGGFCCDQVVQYVPSIDRFVWIMQSCGVGGCLNGPNRERIAAASPAALRMSGGTAWTFWDITPATLNLGSSDVLDHPDIAVGSKSLYVSFDDASGPFGTFGWGVGYGLVVMRIPLAQILAGSAITFQFTHPQDSQQAMLGQISQNSGTRVFWAGHNSNSSIRVFSLDDSSNKYHWQDVAIGTWSNDTANFSAVTPDGNNWLLFDQARGTFPVVGATRVGSSALVLAWNAARGSGFTQPHVEWIKLNVRVDPITLVSQQQVFSSTDAIAYPALTVNGNGEVGISTAAGSGGNFENHAVGFLGDNELFTTGVSDTGVSRFGDYMSIRRDVGNPERFDAFGYGIIAGVPDTRFVIFGRGTASAPTFNRVSVNITTGNDNAADSSEIIAHVGGQAHPICLKPSSSLAPDGVCPNGGSGITWDNWSGHSKTLIPLDTPQTSSAAFGSMTVTLIQSGIGDKCLSCDNWDIQGLKVVVSDSTGKLAPVTLLNTIATPLSGDNCIARLRAPPNATTVRFMLDGSGVRTYTNGQKQEPGETTTCTNNEPSS